MVTKTRAHGIRNYTKARALLFLNKNDGYLFSTSEIARGANVNLGSLYVLLTRWERWGYVHCDNRWTDKKHRLYSIGAAGKAYLRALPKWFSLFNEAVAEVELASLPKVCYKAGDTWHILAINEAEGKAQYYTLATYPGGIVTRGPVSMFSFAESQYKFKFSDGFKTKVMAHIG